MLVEYIQLMLKSFPLSIILCKTMPTNCHQNWLILDHSVTYKKMWNKFYHSIYHFILAVTWHLSLKTGLFKGKKYSNIHISDHPLTKYIVQTMLVHISFILIYIGLSLMYAITQGKSTNVKDKLKRKRIW